MSATDRPRGEDDDTVEAAVPDQARVAGAGQHVVGDRPAQTLTLAGIAEQRDQRLVLEIEHRLRQRSRETRRQVGVDVVVGRDVQTVAPRLFDEREIGAGALAGAPLGGVVRDLDGDAALTPDGERLGDGLEDRLALAADVRGVDRPVTGEYAA
jgi:hypothetical protein